MEDTYSPEMHFLGKISGGWFLCIRGRCPPSPYILRDLCCGAIAIKHGRRKPRNPPIIPSSRVNLILVSAHYSCNLSQIYAICMADSWEQLSNVNGVPTGSLQSDSLQGRVYWCRSCRIQVVPRAGRGLVCPECQNETLQLVSTSGTPLPSANGLRFRGRQRVASESDLSRLGGRNDEEQQVSPLSLSGVLMGHNQPRSDATYPPAGVLMGHNQPRSDMTHTPAGRPPWFGRWAYEIDDWEDILNSNPMASLLYEQDVRHEQDERRAHLSAVEGSNWFPSRPWGAGSLTLTRNPEPTWQQFMQEVLRNFLGRRERIPSIEAPDLASDPGDYVDDPRGFERLLSELAENDSINLGSPPAAKSAVDALPSITVKQQHIDDDSASCPVCKEHMELGEVVKELPCQHLYHESCILPWFDVRNSCPVCRFELPTDNADYEARKRAMASNRPSVNGQERGGDDGSRVLSVQEEADMSRRFYPNVGMGESEEEDEVYVVELRNGGDTDSNQGRRGGWLWLAARPLLSIVGLVLALTIGHRFMRAQEPIGNRLFRDQLSNPRQDMRRI